MHSNALMQFHFKFECCKPHKGVSHPTKCDVINDVKLFPTVYRRIYCRKFLTLSNQTSHYKSKCIRIIVICLLLHCGLFLVLLWSILRPFYFCNHLTEEGRAVCFALIVFLWHVTVSILFPTSRCRGLICSD